jgi:hypothetical protein
VFLIGAMLVSVHANAQENEPAVPAQRTAVVSGHVVAAADGRPLARALVTLESASSGAHRVLADERGAFEIEAPAGRVVDLADAQPVVLGPARRRVWTW